MDLALSVLLGVQLVFTVPLDIWAMRDRKKTENYGIDMPGSVVVLLGIPSLFLWLLWILAALGKVPPLWSHLRVLGLFLCGAGVVLFVSARWARGKYAPGWGLHDEVKLASRGPYRVIRHPSYLAYCLYFIGVPLATGFLPALVLAVGIFGYVKGIPAEEELLIRHFGNQYRAYQRRTWRLLPFVW